MSKETPHQKYLRKVNAQDREDKKQEYIRRLENLASDSLKSLHIVCDQLGDDRMTEIHYYPLVEELKEIKRFKKVFSIK